MKVKMSLWKSPNLAVEEKDIASLELISGLVRSKIFLTEEAPGFSEEMFLSLDIPEKVPIDLYVKDFDTVRRAYPGVKRGLVTEYTRFKKTHKDYKAVVPIMLAALTNQINRRAAKMARNQFVPEWKHFSTWLYQRCWEEEVGATVPVAPVETKFEMSDDMKMMAEKIKRDQLLIKS